MSGYGSHHLQFSSFRSSPAILQNSSQNALPTDFAARERREIRCAIISIRQRLEEMEDDLTRLHPKCQDVDTRK